MSDTFSVSAKNAYKIPTGTPLPKPEPTAPNAPADAFTNFLASFPSRESVAKFYGIGVPSPIPDLTATDLSRHVLTGATSILLGTAKGFLGAITNPIKTVSDLASGVGQTLQAAVAPVSGGAISPSQIEAAANLTMLVGGVRVPFRTTPGTAGVFASNLYLKEGSATAAKIDAELQQVQQYLHDNPNLSPEEVAAAQLKGAGLSKDGNGNIVYELDDSQSKLSTTGIAANAQALSQNTSMRWADTTDLNRVHRGVVTLPEILIHDEAYDILPYLQKTLVKDSGPGQGGWYNQYTNTIYIDFALPPEYLHSGILHEMNHAIQWHDRTLGTNRPLGQTSDPTVLVPQLNTFIATFNRLRNTLPKEEIVQIDTAMRAIGTEALVRLSSGLDPSWAAYWRDTGEVESRNVEDRMYMTEAQRRNLSSERTQQIPFREQLDLNRFSQLRQDAAGQWGYTTDVPMPQSAPPVPSVPAPIFFSAVQRVLENTPLKRATAEQWAATIANAPGVKQEELDWLKLDDFLSENAGKKLTKEEVLGFVKDNQVEVKVVTKRGMGLPNNWNQQQINRFDYLEAVENNGDIEPTEASELDKLRSEMGEAGFNNTNTVEYTQYQLPGGTDYQEKVLTLPGLSTPVISDVSGKVNPFIAPKTIYTSSHFPDEANPIAHYRTNTRIINGQDTLFAEELQSDWHQAGNNWNYQGQPGKLKNGWSIAPDSGNISGGFDHPANRWIITDLQTNTITISGATQQLALNRFVDQMRLQPPPAPFARTWPRQILIRMIREAADKGYAQIGWTSGAVQEARFPGTRQAWFYDKELVDEANKIGKQFGARVEEAHTGDNSGNAKVFTLKITPELYDASINRGFSLFNAAPILPPTFSNQEPEPTAEQKRWDTNAANLRTPGASGKGMSDADIEGFLGPRPADALPPAAAKQSVSNEPTPLDTMLTPSSTLEQIGAWLAPGTKAVTDAFAAVGENAANQFTMTPEQAAANEEKNKAAMEKGAQNRAAFTEATQSAVDAVSNAASNVWKALEAGNAGFPSYTNESGLTSIVPQRSKPAVAPPTVLYPGAPRKAEETKTETEVKPPIDRKKFVDQWKIFFDREPGTKLTPELIKDAYARAQEREARASGKLVTDGPEAMMKFLDILLSIDEALGKSQQ